MATIIRGGFKDNKERLITIDIYSPLGMGEYDLNEENSPIKIAYDSIEIEYDIDDMFEPIIKKTMKIDVVTTSYFGDVLFSDRVKQVKVTVKMENDVLFAGYVEPYTYSQDYSEKLNEFTLNCIDELGCLEYFYIVKHADWKSVIGREQPISFKEYLSMILPTNTYYDMSKKVGGNSALDALAVSQEIFLGDSEDDMKTHEEVLEIILKYLNLHIIQEGNDLLMFDWNTLKKKRSSQEFTNIFDGSTKTINMSNMTIDKDAYTDDSTNISVSDTYNQIKLKVNLDTNDTIIKDPLDTENLKFYSNYKQLWFREISVRGNHGSAQDSFRNIVRQSFEHPDTINDSYEAWTATDWYFKLAYNPQWKVMYNGVDVGEWLERDSQGNPIYLTRVLELMKNYRFFPALLSAGKNESPLNRNNPTRLTNDGGVKGSIQSNNYIVISVNGRGDDSEEELKNIQWSIDRSSGYDQNTNKAKGLLEYVGTSNGQYSPTDDNTINYIIFKGSMTLNPRIFISGFGSFWYALGSWQGAAENRLFESVYNYVNNDNWTSPIYDTELYAHQFFRTDYPGNKEWPVNHVNMIYPFLDKSGSQSLEYNYSGHWDDTDRFNKMDILECELKIGDKYLVETYVNGDKQKPVYGWYKEENLPFVQGKRKNTFSLGFDPEIGQCIVGREYPITNTVNGKISDEKGMAVPIKKSDALSGKVTFRIIAVVNQQWNEITRRHPTLFRSTKYYDNWRNLWSHVSSIWLKDFEIGIISDNMGSDVPSSKKDIVYMSNMTHDIIRSKDDEEFDICTLPTTPELLANGIETNIAHNTCINLTTNMPTESITDVTQNVTERPERLWVDQYWNIYNKPKCIVNTKLDDSYLKGMNIYTMNTFGDTIPLKIIRNLRNCEAEISLQQINN